ncbi:hypothetical protein LWI28_021243 [Acer negundo]|uniref:Uncharacterized protein n=1 Tax=Acer negundo TaxID=4023 RepID=A0AAD5JIT2_ACENE|nr:hypothetical protein LWI28_021243 [Acer negundo]
MQGTTPLSFSVCSEVSTWPDRFSGRTVRRAKHCSSVVWCGSLIVLQNLHTAFVVTFPSTLMSSIVNHFHDPALLPLGITPPDTAECCSSWPPGRPGGGELIRWIDLEPTPSWQNRSRDMKNRIQMQIRSVELLVMVVLVLVDVVAVMMNLMMKMRLRDSGRRRCRIDDACVIVVAVVIR